MKLIKILSSLFGDKEEIKEIKIEELTEEKLYNLISEKKNEAIQKKSEMLNELKNINRDFTQKIEISISDLESIDLSQKKDFEKLKAVSQQNLLIYINYIKKLKHEIENITEEEPENLSKKIYEYLNSFAKTSDIHYERATILVGKEMDDAKNTIGNFLKNLKIINSKYTNYVEKYKNIIELEKIKKNLIDKKEEEKGLIDKKDYIEKSIKNNKNKADKIKNKISEEKNSKEFQEYIESLNKNKIKKDNLEESLMKIKSEINFKELSRNFHHDKNKMLKINNLKSNFKEEVFHNTSDYQSIIQYDKLEEIKKIKEKLDEINEFNPEIIKKIKILEDSLDKIDKDIINQNEELSILNKIIEKTTKSKYEINKSIDELVKDIIKS